MNDNTDLTEDLEFLQTTHAIDVSMIEFLLASPMQAKAHIRSYKRMMLLTCVLPVVIGGVIIALSVLKFSGMLAIAVCVIGAGLVYHYGYRLVKMSKAIRATEQIAKYHHLI